MRSPLFQAGIAEALGVFMLTFIGGGAICMDVWSVEYGRVDAGLLKGQVGLLGIALAHGFALMVGIYIAAGKSGGHINPAVSIGMWIAGKMPLGRALVYCFYQLLGAVVAGLSLWAMFPIFRGSSPYLGTPSFDDSGGPGAFMMPKAIGFEALLTFVLVITVFMVAVDASRAARQIFGITIGFVLVGLILIGGNLTGAALNPARYFGPAVVSGQVSQLVVYFVGPLLGGGLAAIFYRLFLATPEKEDSPAEG